MVESWLRVSADDPPRPSHDARLRAMAFLLGPAMIGHAIQLLSEDTPWTAQAHARYWVTPGWHLYLSPWLIVAIAVGLAICTLGLAFIRSRPWLTAFVAFYLAHYLTYPFRIRNHMTTMGAALVAIGGCYLIGRASKAIDRDGRGPGARSVDRMAVLSVAVVMVVTYAFAGLHKMNLGFFGSFSSAISGADTFFVYGDLGDHAPTWARHVATYGTLVVEVGFPILACLSTRRTSVFVAGLMLFHFPHIAVMNVADYPMIASVFYPAFYSRATWRVLARDLYQASPANLSGALIGASLQCWFLPYWGAMSVFGVVVAALWGWWIAAMIRSALRARAA